MPPTRPPACPTSGPPTLAQPHHSADQWAPDHPLARVSSSGATSPARNGTPKPRALPPTFSLLFYSPALARARAENREEILADQHPPFSDPLQQLEVSIHCALFCLGSELGNGLREAGELTATFLGFWLLQGRKTFLGGQRKVWSPWGAETSPPPPSATAQPRRSCAGETSWTDFRSHFLFSG